jgi:hypothetical protein
MFIKVFKKLHPGMLDLSEADITKGIWNRCPV